MRRRAASCARCLSYCKRMLYGTLKVAHTRLWFRSWSLFLTVSLQVMWVMNPAVGCHDFPPGLQLPSHPLRGMQCYQFRCSVNRSTMGVNSLPETVTWQRCDCDLNPGPSALESSTLTTRLPSHPMYSNVNIFTKRLTITAHVTRYCCC